MRITVAVPVLNQQEVTQQFIDNLRAHEKGKLPLLIIDNGSNPPVRDWLIGLRDIDTVIRNSENVGVLKALNQAWQVAKDSSDYIFYTHNDVMIYEDGWDTKLERILEEQAKLSKDLGHLAKVGVATFYGAKGIGTSDIYKSPYIMQQMIRLENVSNCTRMDANHGYRPIRGEVEDVAVADGFSLIVSVELLNRIGGFDRTFPVHHMYDNDICLESLDKGFRNIVIPMDAQHLGGRTDVGENWAEPFGKTKQQVHQEAHPIFYEKWSPAHVADGRHKICMPIRLP